MASVRNNSREDTIELRVPCKAEYVRTVRALVADIADTIPLSARDVEEVKVAASEAVANIIRHAYRGSTTVGPIFVTCTRHSKKLVVEVVDWGVGFAMPPIEAPSTPDVSREGGYGIILIHNLMDSVEYWSEPNVGTRIRMVKTASTKPSPMRVRRSVTPQPVA